MPILTIDLDQFPGSLADALTSASSDQEIVIAKGNKPFLKATPIGEGEGERISEEMAGPKQPRRPGLCAGTFVIHDEDTFDDPLPDSFWLGKDIAQSRIEGMKLVSVDKQLTPYGIETF